MPPRHLRSDALLLLTALIWGFAFVAQRLGMEHVGPYTFNAVRFALGSLVLVPLVFRRRAGVRRSWRAGDLWAGVLAGGALFAGASFQQIGLVYTTAGNAGFITGLYVVLVPILGLPLGERTGGGTWAGALTAAVGLYLLSVDETFRIAYGDLLELVGAFFWAAHVLLIGRLSRRIEPTRLAFVQFGACAVLSLAAALLTETATPQALADAALPILYGGVLSVGVAYTLQVVAQRRAHPAHASILLSLEAVFAALGGWWILGEVLTPRGLLGCTLMLAGMLLSQLHGYWVARPLPAAE